MGKVQTVNDSEHKIELNRVVEKGNMSNRREVYMFPVPPHPAITGRNR
jgi:hypothetical protein